MEPIHELAMLGLKDRPHRIFPFSAAVGYAADLGAQLGISNTEYPFRILTHKNATLEQLERELSRRSIPGIQFERKMFGGSNAGLYVKVTD